MNTNPFVSEETQAKVNDLFQTFVTGIAALAAGQAPIHAASVVFALDDQNHKFNDVLILSSFGNSPNGMMEVAHMFRDFAHQGMPPGQDPISQLLAALGGQQVDLGIDGVSAMMLPLGEHVHGDDCDHGTKQDLPGTESFALGEADVGEIPADLVKGEPNQ